MKRNNTGSSISFKFYFNVIIAESIPVMLNYQKRSNRFILNYITPF